MKHSVGDCARRFVVPFRRFAVIVIFVIIVVVVSFIIIIISVVSPVATTPSANVVFRRFCLRCLPFRVCTDFGSLH
jgi:hypothetical protein